MTEIPERGCEYHAGVFYLVGCDVSIACNVLLY